MMPLLLLLRLLLFCYFYISPPHSPSPFFLSCCPSVRILWPGAMMAGRETTQPRRTRGGKPPGIDVMVMPVLGETLFLASSPLRNRRGRIEPKKAAIFEVLKTGLCSREAGPETVSQRVFFFNLGTFPTFLNWKKCLCLARLFGGSSRIANTLVLFVGNIGPPPPPFPSSERSYSSAPPIVKKCKSSVRTVHAGAVNKKKIQPIKKTAPCSFLASKYK